MHISVEASLKKLRTSYIDILYVHWVRAYPFTNFIWCDKYADRSHHSGTSTPPWRRS